MGNLSELKPNKVFKYFEELCKIPRGSGDMERISTYCVDFAKSRGLEVIKDEANNVIIRKGATKGYEHCDTIILQGHLDMVCQKADGIEKDFLNDGIEAFVDGDFVTAKGTTLGADNGIAVAIALAILDSDDLCHPPLEALFTTDEEIGLIGATKLDGSNIKGNKMINIDAEEPRTITVSCAGGSDFKMILPVSRKKASGELLNIVIKGLKGGHSGIEINNFRTNANILMGRILNFIDGICNMEIVSVDGGDKGNAIPNSCVAKLVVDKDIEAEVNNYIEIIKNEIISREPDFTVGLSFEGASEQDVIEQKDKLIFALTNVPNGVLDMSAEIKGLVETSLNLGILKTMQDKILMQFALRSNKQTSLYYLEERLKVFSKFTGAEVETSGHYPPWEYKKDSKVREDFIKVFNEFGIQPKIEAIHAGLECGVLSSKIKDLDCIAIGPLCLGAHTVEERVSISSTEETYNLIVKYLENCK